MLLYKYITNNLKHLYRNTTTLFFSSVVLYLGISQSEFIGFTVLGYYIDAMQDFVNICKRLSKT